MTTLNELNELSQAELRAHAVQLISVLVDMAARYIEDQPLGSYVPLRELGAAVGGIGIQLNLKAVQERMVELGYKNSFWMLKLLGSTTGLIIIRQDAMDEIKKEHKRHS